MADKKLIKRVKFAGLHRLIAGISLITFTVVLIAGLRAEARFFTIAMRGAIAMIIISLISRVIMRVISSYEEMNGGEA